MKQDGKKRKNNGPRGWFSRRTALKAIAASTVSLAGCIGSGVEDTTLSPSDAPPVAFGYGGAPVPLSRSTHQSENPSLGAMSTATQSPYGGEPASAPCRVHAEDFDVGGEGVAYHDTTANNLGGSYRPDSGVDIEATGDGEGYNVAAIDEGEWIEYTLAVPAGTYDVNVRVASVVSEGAVGVEFDGVQLGSVDVPDTGGWWNWRTLTVAEVTVDQDTESILRLEALGDRFNVDWFEFVLADANSTTTTTSEPSDTQSPYGGEPATIPGRVQAEDFDAGGEGVAYHDTTANNLGGSYRPDSGVDIEATGDGEGYNVAAIDEGEWLEYTLAVPAGTYDVNVSVAGIGSEGALGVEFDGVQLGSVDVPDTGGWWNWRTLTVAEVTVDQDTESILRLEVLGDRFNVNWFEFVPADENSTTTTTSTPTTTTSTSTTTSTTTTSTTTTSTTTTSTTTTSTSTSTTTTTTLQDDYGEQGYGEYGYGG